MTTESVSQLESLAGFAVNSAPEGAANSLPRGFLDLYSPLHARFTPRQQELIRKRKAALDASHSGKRPQHLPPSEATRSDWKITLPEWCRDQRNQMTGPADDADLVVKMLNSGAPGVMLDLEDSMANCWPNLELGISNIVEALHGTLTYFDKKRNKVVGIQPSQGVILTRARGLHISQAGVTDGLTSASLYDVARVAFAVDSARLKHPLCFYIPKSESAEEALWWRDLFQAIEDHKGWQRGTIKCMALVESHPLAYQIEEFLFNLRDHILGLNLGRWDYMASLLHFNLNDPDWVLPDRNTIPHDVAFFQNLRELIPQICHRRGGLAIGGMTALYPSRDNAELNQRALTTLAQDKKNEATCGMDGAWTGHPDQNAIALEQFPDPNQLAFITPKFERYPDLRPIPRGVGKKTVAGTRAAVRTAIRYRNGVLNGKGASLLDGYMEDLATDRIYRLMIAQRMRHRDSVEIEDDGGGKVAKHTPEFISRLFDEELQKLLAALPQGTPGESQEKYRQARAICEAMVINEEVDPI